MKHSFKNPYLLFSVLGLALVNSCTEPQKPKETTKPTVSITSATPELEKEDDLYKMKIRTGSTFQLTVKLEDNEDLSQVKVEIHDVEDGHTHRLSGEAPKWFLDSTYNISGKLVNWTKSFTVPADVWAGTYHVIIKSVDKAGNESALSEVDLTIVSINAPTLSSVTSSVVDSKISKGQIITVTGVIADAGGLVGGEIEIHLESSKDEEAHIDYEIPATATSPYTFSIVVPVPANAPVGKYHLHLEAKDKEGNKEEEEIELTLE